MVLFDSIEGDEMIGGIIIGLLFAVVAFFIIGILGYLEKMDTRLKELEMAEKSRRNDE